MRWRWRRDLLQKDQCGVKWTHFLFGCVVRTRYAHVGIWCGQQEISAVRSPGMVDTAKVDSVAASVPPGCDAYRLSTVLATPISGPALPHDTYSAQCTPPACSAIADWGRTTSSNISPLAAGWHSTPTRGASGLSAEAADVGISRRSKSAGKPSRSVSAPIAAPPYVSRRTT